MTRRPWTIAGLLFLSGLCALVYQTVWMREFRLIFGASTYATAAVLAIFMGGLGVGSALLGRRADTQSVPLAFYARLELYIALTAAVSPFVLGLVEKIYLASGGSPQLGLGGATVLRLVLAVLVIGPATILMGGTLPAAARAAESGGDEGRRIVALLYGANAIGAVAGAMLSTFLLIESLGNRTTLFIAVVLNVVVSLRARALARRDSQAPVPPPAPAPVEVEEAAVSPRLVYAAAAMVGFAFLLMELVWYRMLSPLLGGTAYMFGLVLAMALLGIGTGGAAYALLRSNRRATVGAFAMTCGFEALALLFPFALGDHLAVFAGVLRTFAMSVGFGGHVLVWAIVTAVVVFPAAFVSGIQFPLLVALLGRGDENVGRQIGAAYAWNTLGAIAGSLAGGFGLLPLLTATETWRATGLLLTLLAGLAVMIALRRREWGAVVTTVTVCVLSVVAAAATGPTAVWRHLGIGVGRMPVMKTRNTLVDWMYSGRRRVVWERDGRESSVALTAMDDLAFIVNGKSDGSARHDAGTQVMSGLIASMLHPNPTKAMVIGLGTGSTAGWLAVVPTMQRVDVVELEPVVLDVARACASVNAGAMANPKVNVILGDAREVLLTSDEKYDVISSEPSNPYRAGIASLFTREFYESVRDRLTEQGILAQWAQAYSVHGDTVQTIYATLRTVFPYVQTWTTPAQDLILIASMKPLPVDEAVIRARLSAEPYASAAYHTWHIRTAEGFVRRMIANEDYAAAASMEAEDLNTDDRTVIEFGFARTIGDQEDVRRQIIVEAQRLGMNRPSFMRGTFDWNAPEMHAPMTADEGTPAARAFDRAGQGDVRVEPFAHSMATLSPVDSRLILAAVRTAQGRTVESDALLRAAFIEARRFPWTDVDTFGKGIELAVRQARAHPESARALHDALSRPFVAALQETRRRWALITLAPLFDQCGAATLAALRDVEPYPYWGREMLTIRANCYQIAGAPEAAEAWEDLEEFMAAEPMAIVRQQPGRR